MSENRERISMAARRPSTVIVGDHAHALTAVSQQHPETDHTDFAQHRPTCS